MKNLFFRIACLSLLVVLCACMPRIPLFSSKRSIDADVVKNGQKSVVVMRVNLANDLPVESRWTNVATGEEIKLTSLFAALTRSGALDYDMVTVPPGEYVLTYLLFSRGGTGIPWSPASFDRSAPASPLGQVIVHNMDSTPPVITLYALRSRGIQADGETPSLASFTVEPGKVLYAGDIVVSFAPSANDMKPGRYAATEVNITVQDDTERARKEVESESAELIRRFEKVQVKRSSLLASQQ